MPNENVKQLDKTWVCASLCDVTTKKTAWVLVQEPGFIGFGVVRQDKIFWPMPSDWKPDWERVSDLRLFGEKGEWHVWLDWERKHQCRLLEFDEQGKWHIWLGSEGKKQDCSHKQGEKNDTITEHHALWGTDVKCPQTKNALDEKDETHVWSTDVKCPQIPWVKLREDRGAEIWIPPLKDVKLTEDDIPLRLEIKQVIGYDPKYSLAGIVDAALVALVRKSDDKTHLIPSTDPLCAKSEPAETTCSNLDADAEATETNADA